MNSGRLARTNNLDRSDAKTSRLFGLFALNRQKRLESSPRISDANNQSLQLDWDEFCHDIFNKPESSGHFSTWQQLSQQILRLNRSHSIIAQASMPSRSKQPLLDAIRIDSKFEKSFNVAMYFTVRALRIKGVGDDIIAKARSTLKEKQSQQIKDRQRVRATQAGKSRRPVVEHHQFDSGAPVLLSPFTRSASLPVRSRCMMMP